MVEHNFNDAQSKPGLTADGLKWYQNCYVCNKQINFLKAAKESWITIDKYVRHRKCYPPPIK